MKRSSLLRPRLTAVFLFSFIPLPAHASPDDAAENLAAARQAMERASGGPVDVRSSRLTGLASFVRASRGIPVAGRSAEERALSFLAAHGKAFGLRDSRELRHVRSTLRDLAGMDHVRYQQVHGGVPVTGAELIVHLRGARVIAANGRALPKLEGFSTQPLAEPAAALRAAREVLSKHLGVSDAALSEPRLEIFDRGLIGGAPAPKRLAWFVEATRLDLRQFIWIDANTGGVLLRFSQLPHAKSRKIYTANSTAALPGTLLRSEGGPPTGDPDADAAYEFAGDTYDYYFNEHGRDSYDDNGAQLKSTVHYCPSPVDCPYANAFWNGVQMVYGEGFSAADDVDAHELTHAVTEYAAGLFYYMQSGALNESFSDIFGETVDLTNGAGDDTPGVRWAMGEDVPGFGAIRNMMDPTLFGDPGKMSDLEFKCFDDGFLDSGGVHSNSGVPNHAYQLMVDGGTYNGITVTGLGLTKAGKIQYRSLTSYLTSAANFLDNYDALNQSCSDLIGVVGITAGDCTSVADALQAVEMDAVWGGPTTPCFPTQPSEPALCSAGQGPVNVFFDDLENTKSGNWSSFILGGWNHWMIYLYIAGIPPHTGTPPIYFEEFASSGRYHFWGYDFSAAGHSTVNMARSFLLPPGARMQFNHSFGFENSGTTYWDGGLLEYSTNNGATWVDAGGLISGGAAYNGSITTFDINPLAGRNAFVGESWGYAATQLDLSSLAGQSVRFRFHIGTDSCCEDRGWFIDDVRIYTCDVGGSVEFSGPSFVGSEATGTATISATRSGGQAEGVAVDYFSSGGSATPGSDYTAVLGSLSFGSGVTSKTFAVPIANDTVDDDNETVGLSLTNVSGPSATLGAQDQTTLTITDNDVAGTLQFSLASYSVGEAGPQATITVSRTGGAASNVTVSYQTSNGTADGTDYTSTSGTLTFGAGQTSRTFMVPITNDAFDENNETLQLQLTGAGGGGVLGSRTQATLSIVDNDAGGTLQFSAIAYSVSEGGGSLLITVSRSGGAAEGVTVSYATTDGTATAGSDYTASSGVLSFGANLLSQTFSVPILEDTLGENNENVKLSLNSPTGGATLGLRSTATLTILENEAVLQFGAPNYSMSESRSAATFTVLRSGLLTSSVTVAYETSDGTAQAGSDYGSTSGTLSFGPRVASRTFTVPITNDAVSEPGETVLLALSNPAGAGAALGPRGTTVLTITDNDALLQFSAAAYAAAENAPSALITVKRTGSTAGSATVNYGSSDDTATEGSDYTAAAGTLSFAAGVASRTFNVPILDDSDAEPAERVRLDLSSPGGGAGLGTIQTAYLTINDNEPRVQFNAAAYSVSEAGGMATIMVRRTGATGATVEVPYSASDGTANVGSDYQFTPGTLTFGPAVVSRTFTVPILNDGDGEGNETVNLSLGTPTGGGLGSPATAVLTITDNEPLLAFSVASYAVGEATGAATIMVKRSGPTNGTVSVQYAASDGTATEGPDYGTTAGTLSFGPGVVSRTFTVPIVNDSDAEGSETVNLSLTNPSTGAGLGALKDAVLTITDSEPVVSFKAAIYKVTELSKSVVLTVSRAGDRIPLVTVPYTMNDGTATGGSDYTSASGTLTFGSGVISRTISIPILNDTLDENEEEFTVTLGVPSGAALGTPATATVKIGDNDAAGAIQFSAATFSAGEGAGFAVITVVRSGGTASDASVAYAASDGTATDGQDFTASSGVLTFGAGVTSLTFTVPILEDASLEGNETVMLSLSSPSGGATLGATSSATLWIVDDD